MIDPAIIVYCPQCTASMKRGSVLRLSPTKSGNRYTCNICDHQEAIYFKTDIIPRIDYPTSDNHAFFTDDEIYDLKLAFMELGIEPELN